MFSLLRQTRTTLALTAVTLAALPSLAVAQARTPDANFNGRDTSYELSAGSQLRVGDRLTDRLLYSVWERTVVKGTGSCTTNACPVTFNGQEVYARRTRLTMLDANAARPGDTPGAAGRPGGDRYPAGWKRLQRGDSGDKVRELQELLVRDGAKDIKPDGRFGRSTETAVRDLQRRKRLPADGVVGYETLRALGI
jgi:hypothetical protein